MRNLVLTIHAYLGLLCLPYILIFGISSLDFNHHFLEKEQRTLINTLTVKVETMPFQEGEELGTILRDSLHLFGWYIPWESYSDNVKHHIMIAHFGKEYEIEKFRNSDEVTMKVYALPAGKVLFGLHALGGDIPNAPAWINVWKYYQDLTVYASLFWALAGVYLWATQRRRSSIPLWALIIISCFSLTLMMYLWLAG